MPDFRRDAARVARRLAVNAAITALCGHVAPAIAQAPVPATPAAAPAPSKPPIFRVRGPRGTVYLVGSMHLLPADVYPLDPAVERAYAASGRVVFEARIDSLQMRAQEIGARMMLPAGRTLQQTVSAQTYARLAQVLPAFGLKPEQVQGIKPNFLGLNLAALASMRAGYGAASGFDVVMTRRAKEDGKALGGLEAVDHQVALIDSIPPTGQEYLLRLGLIAPDSLIQQQRDMAAAWRTGDDAAMRRLTEPLAGDASVYRALVTARNQAWAPQVEAMLRAPGTTMVVVGAGHLVARDNLVDLLRRDGFRVERL
jgi:uncharacterized protein YbaP (TraB family)